jgi:hypothetical protein
MFKTDYSILYLLIIIPVAATAAYLLYRRADIPKGRKRLLTALRGISIFLILFLLLFPVISYLSDEKITPANIILIDNSKSITLENRDSISTETVNELHSKTGSDINFRYFLFSNGLYKEYKKDEQTDFYRTDNSNTDFSKTLSDLLDRTASERITGITFITDGIATKGNDISLNANAYNYFFNYIRIGDTSRKKDIVIEDVLYNRNAYTDSKTPIMIKIKSYGFTKKTEVKLFEDGALKDAAPLELNTNKTDYEIKFEIASIEEGIKKYSAEIGNEDSEITYINNKKIFYIRFIPNTFDVAIISAGPSADYSFFTEQVKKISNIKPRFFTQKTGNDFYEGFKPELKDVSAVILFGYPTSHSNAELIYSAKSEIERYKLPLFFFATSNTDYGKLKQLENSLPFTISGTEPSETETTLKSTVFNEESKKKFSGLDGIENFPAIFFPCGVIAMKPQSEVFLANINSDPVFFIQNSSAAFCSYGIHRWRLNPGDYDYDKVFKNILSGAITTISDYDKNKKIAIELLQNEYSPFEKIDFKIRLHPSINGEEDSIRVRIYNDNFDKILKPEKTGEREYKASEVLTEKGDYFLDAYYLNTPGIGTQERFTVDINRTEFINTKPDENFLKRLAENTGGKDFTNLNSSDIIAELNRQGENRISESQTFKNIYLNYSWLYLISIVFLLALEWYIRKRSFLP